MANEAVIIELLGFPPGEPVQYTVANGVTISGGTLCYLVEPRTASGSAVSIANPVPAGIAATDKLANDGSTTLAFYTHGIFDLVAAPTAITLGHPVMISGSNLISGALNVNNVGEILGICLETAAASERVAVKVRL